MTAVATAPVTDPAEWPCRAGGPHDVIGRVLARPDLTALDLQVALAVVLDTALSPTAPLPDVVRVAALARVDEPVALRALTRLDTLTGCTPAALRPGPAWWTDDDARTRGPRPRTAATP